MVRTCGDMGSGGHGVGHGVSFRIVAHGWGHTRMGSGLAITHA